MKTAELEGANLDYWVAKAESLFILEKDWEIAPGGVYAEWIDEGGVPRSLLYSPSTEWWQGGPIIERERINIHHYTNSDRLFAECRGQEPNRTFIKQEGPTPLIAAMRAYVASKYGDTVPDL